MGRIIVRDELKTPMADNYAGSLIAIVGRTQSDDGAVEKVRAAEALAMALDDRRCRSAVYSRRVLCAEPDVVRASLGRGMTRDNSQEVYCSVENRRPVAGDSVQPKRCLN